LPRKFTYSNAGVDRELRAHSKKALGYLKKTYGYSHYGKLVDLPYGKIFPGIDCYFGLVIEGVGTKGLDPERDCVKTRVAFRKLLVLCVKG